MSFCGRKNNAQDNGEHWLVISDLMAGLMIVFLFIALVFMLEKQKSPLGLNHVTQVYQDKQKEIYDVLTAEFGKDLKKWRANIDKETLSFNFQSPEKLFASSSLNLTPFFRGVLSDFFPRYLKVLKPFQNIVDEVRIEGHTSSSWNRNSTKAQAYLKNLQLSQVRTREMLRFIYSLEANETQWMKHNILAIGFSSSQMVKEKGVENTFLSRRVSFRALLNTQIDFNPLLSATHEVNG